MDCPKCHAPNSLVLRPVKGGETVERTRMCPECRYKWHTTECITSAVEVQAWQAYLWTTVCAEHNERLKEGNNHEPITA